MTAQTRRHVVGMEDGHARGLVALGVEQQHARQWTDLHRVPLPARRLEPRVLGALVDLVEQADRGRVEGVVEVEQDGAHHDGDGGGHRRPEGFRPGGRVSLGRRESCCVGEL